LIFAKLLLLRFVLFYSIQLLHHTQKLEVFFRNKRDLNYCRANFAHAHTVCVSVLRRKKSQIKVANAAYVRSQIYLFECVFLAQTHAALICVLLFQRRGIKRLALQNAEHVFSMHTEFLTRKRFFMRITLSARRIDFTYSLFFKFNFLMLDLFRSKLKKRFPISEMRDEVWSL